MRIPLLRLESHSASRLFAHLVWSTRSRALLLPPERDAWLETILTDAARRVGCGMLAAGNAGDHVHVVLCFPPRLAVAEIAKSLKGASARRYNQEVPVGEGGPLRWQVGYYAESVGHGSLAGLTRYVQKQRMHHAGSSVRDEWELPDESCAQR